MRDGKRLTSPTHDLDQMRHYAAEQIAWLPQPVRGLPEADPPYPVEISPKLNAYHEEVVRQTTQRSLEARVDSVE